MNPKFLKVVLDGLKAVVASGTAGATKLGTIEVAGKTGSAEAPPPAVKPMPGLLATRLQISRVSPCAVSSSTAVTVDRFALPSLTNSRAIFWFEKQHAVSAKSRLR